MGLGDRPPLERKAQVKINTLASEYKRLLDVHCETFHLADELGVLNNDSLEEIFSFVGKICFLRLLLVCCPEAL